MSGYKKRMIITIGVMFVVFSAISAAYYRSLDCLPFIYGALLGAAVSIVKVFVLAHAVDKSLKKEEKAAANYLRFNHLLRLGLTGVALVLGALAIKIWDTSVLWGTAAGVLSYQVAVYILKYTAKDKEATLDKSDNTDAIPSDISDTAITEAIPTGIGDTHTIATTNIETASTGEADVVLSDNNKESSTQLTNANLSEIKEQIKRELREEIRAEIKAELVKEGESGAKKPKEGT